MTVMDYYCQPRTESAGEVGAMLRTRLLEIARHQANPFDTFASLSQENLLATRHRRRFSIQELLGEVTPEAMARINQETAWVQNDPSVGDEL